MVSMDPIAAAPSTTITLPPLLFCYHGQIGGYMSWLAAFHLLLGCFIGAASVGQQFHI